MPTRKDVRISFLRSFAKGDIMPFTDMRPENMQTLRSLCQRLKDEGYRFETTFRPELNMAIVRRKRSCEP